MADPGWIRYDHDARRDANVRGPRASFISSRKPRADEPLRFATVSAAEPSLRPAMKPRSFVCSVCSALLVLRSRWCQFERKRILSPSGNRFAGRRAVAGVLTLMSGLAVCGSDEQMVFDDMREVRSEWTAVEGEGPSRSTSQEIAAQDPPYMRLDNGLIRSELGRPVEGSWTLSFKAALSTEQRGLWVGAFNADGTQGLAVKWDSAAIAGPEGRVTLLRFDLDSEVGWRTAGEPISAGLPSGHPVNDGTLAAFTLHYDAGSRALAVLVNDIPLTQVLVPDPVVGELSRVYVRGNETAYFDDIAFRANRLTHELLGAARPALAWAHVDGSGAALEVYPGGTRFRLNNGLLMTYIAPVADRTASLSSRQQSALEAPVQDDWTLAFDAAHSARERSLWVGVFDRTRTKGYGVLWDSALRGTGVVTIRKFDLESEVRWADKGVALTEPVRSGHNPLDPLMARIELSWDRDTRTLYLAVDGVPRAHVVDGSFDTFHHLFVRGNSTSYFDNFALLSETPRLFDTILNIAIDGFRHRRADDCVLRLRPGLRWLEPPG